MFRALDSAPASPVNLSTVEQKEPRASESRSDRGPFPLPLAAPSQARLAYILAASHSGSTLLAMLLGAHPEACTGGELKGIRGNPDTYRCSCGALLNECEFWQRVNRGMAQHGFDFAISRARTNIQETKHAFVRRLLEPLHRGPFLECVRDTGLGLLPAWHSHLRRIQSRNSAFVRTLADVSGASIVVDSSKVGLRLKYLLRNPELDVRVLRLIRDGRGVALTHTNPAEFADATNPNLRSGGTGGPGHNGLSMTDAASLWRRSNEEADCVTATLPRSQYMEVRYEQLCLEPSATMQRVCEFLGMTPLPIDAGFRERKKQHIVGNGMRFDTTSDIRLDERWKNHLSSEALKEFDRVAGDLNRQYGYR